MARDPSSAAPREWLYGLHAVQAVLKTEPDRVAELRLLRGRRDRRIGQIRELAARHGIAATEASRSELDAVASGNHQGVVALCETGAVRDENYLDELLGDLQGPPLLLILDGVTDPHNVGACLRTADAAGVQAVIVPRDKSAGMSATVRKVASGAADNIAFVVVTNLARTLRRLQQQGVWVVGTAGDAAEDVFAADLRGPLALVLGAEGSGLRRLTREHCDLLVKLPMAGSVSSLNVSVAAGVCLYEALRQRRGA